MDNYDEDQFDEDDGGTSDPNQPSTKQEKHLAVSSGNTNNRPAEDALDLGEDYDDDGDDQDEDVD